MLLRRQDDKAQFRHRAFLGLQVDRLNIQERATRWDDKQVAATHARALLIPERELTGQLRVLIYARFDLQRAVNQSRSREIIDEKMAVSVAVAAASDPANHVVLVGGRKRHYLDKL